MLTEREIETNRICVVNSFCIATCRHNDWSKPNTRDFYDKELDKTLPQKMLCQDFLGKCLFLHHHGMPDTEHVCAVRYAGYETFPCQTSNLSEINMPTSFATIFCLVVFFGSPFPQAVAFCQKKSLHYSPPGFGKPWAQWPRPSQTFLQTGWGGCCW